MRSVVAFGGFTYAGGYEAVCETMDTILEERITAVFAANDLMAMGAIQALRENGLRVPDDVSVVGCDDITAARLVSPALTTVRQDPQELGRRAVQELVKALITDKGSPRRSSAKRIAIPVELVVRQSTAAPPRKLRSASRTAAS